MSKSDKVFFFIEYRGMKPSMLMTIGLLLVSTILTGQKKDYEVLIGELNTTTGLERIQVLYDLANQDINNDQALCRQRGWEMIDSARLYQSNKYIGWGYRFVGLSYHYTGILDSARYYYELCAPYFEKPKDVGWSYYNIASIFEVQSQFDSVAHYLSLAEPLFRQDTTALVQLGSVNSMKGAVAAAQGNKTKAIEYYLSAKEYMEKAGDMPRKADALRQIAEIYSGQEEYRKAIRLEVEAVQIYKDYNDAYYHCLALSSLGNNYHGLGKLDSARYYFETGLDISRKVNHDFVTGTLLHRLATMNGDEGNLLLARQQFRESIEYARKTNDIYSIVFNLERQSRMEFNFNNYREVLQLTREGILLAEANDLFKSKSELLYWQSKALEQLGNYREALTDLKSHQSIKDSLSSKAQTDKLQELLVEFETEKKEKELVIAQAEIDRKTARNKLLLVGLGGLGILASLIIYMQMMRRRKNELIFLKEKEIETELRRNAEQELEFKKKELVAKTLQLARKNEFLSTLEEEVGALKTTVDTGVYESSRKIQRMIRHDANDDEDWDHFAKEFSTIHQEFIDKLSEQHGPFSTNELRLISLMKMNLSSKDIASTLRVSADGIKKARYRLRKKMGIDSSVDLQEYLLNFG